MPARRAQTQLPSEARRFSTQTGPAGPEGGLGGQSGTGTSPGSTTITTSPSASSVAGRTPPTYVEKTQLPSAASLARNPSETVCPQPRSTAFNPRSLARTMSGPEKRAQGTSEWMERTPNPLDHFALPLASRRTTKVPQLPAPTSGKAPSPTAGAPVYAPATRTSPDSGSSSIAVPTRRESAAPARPERMQHPSPQHDGGQADDPPPPEDVPHDAVPPEPSATPPSLVAVPPASVAVPAEPPPPVAEAPA